MKKEKNTRGITLIALVVTMIVLIILATVSINMVFNDNGIIKQAESAKQITEKEQLKEMVRMEILGYQMKNQNGDLTTEELKEVLNKYFKEVPEEFEEESTLKARGEYGGDNVEVKLSEIYNGKVEKIAKSNQSYVGYYADFQDESGNQTPDGNPDGIIYADLAVGGEGKWNDAEDNSYYRYPAETRKLKTYTIGEQKIVIGFNNYAKEVISLAEGTSGAERFYVMALEDIDENKYTWYKKANGHYPEDKTIAVSSDDFGSGRINTDYWINDEGKLNEMYPLIETDIWQMLKNGSNAKYNIDRWFVPSKDEWRAFGDVLCEHFDVDSVNYGQYGLSERFWTSSLHSKVYPWCARMDRQHTETFMPSDPYCVRMSAIF